MRQSSRLKLALAVWLTGEILAFVLVVKLIGLPEALLVAFITSLFGWTFLKRAGASAMVKLRAALDGRIVDKDGRRFLDDTLATVGALALIAPGFLSDAVGLVLAVPAARDRLSRWIGRNGLGGWRPGQRPTPGGDRKSPSTIDLDPQDWQRSDATRHPVSKV